MPELTACAKATASPPKLPSEGGSSGHVRRIQSSEPPFPGSKIADRPTQLLRCERRPRRRREPQLRVGAFPQQEVTQSLLAPRADEQIDIRGIGCDAPAAAQAPLEFHRRPARTRARGDRGSAQRITRGIVDGEAKMEPPAAGRQPLRHLDLLRKTTRQPIAPSDHREPNAGAPKAWTFDDEISVEERHQARDFRRRTLPVIRGERIKREHVDPERRR